jgi:CheY-like chemotaxis protein
MNSKILHILIVDDNPENIRVLGTALRQKHYRLSVASNSHYDCRQKLN